MIKVPLEREVWARNLTLIEGQNLGEHLFTNSSARRSWKFEFEIIERPSNSFKSSIVFEDTRGLTKRLLTELFFQRELTDVYKFQALDLWIGFNYESSSKYDKTYHTIGLKGHGYHSRVDVNASDFVTEIRTNEITMALVQSLLELATKDLK